MQKIKSASHASLTTENDEIVIPTVSPRASEGGSEGPCV